MVGSSSADQGKDPTSDTVEPAKVEEGAVREGVEEVAPWQQQQEYQPQLEARGDSRESIKQESESGQYQEVEPAAAGLHTVVEGDGSEEVVDFSALGSAEDIAAAALEAANISSLFESAHTNRGTKRSHDDMAEEASTTGNTLIKAEADVNPVTSTTVSSAPSAALTTAAPNTVSATDPLQSPTQSTSIASTSAAVLAYPTSTALVDGNALIAPVAEETEEADDAFLGSLDLEAVAQAAMGLDADGNPLPGNEESHRALADAVKQLSAAQGITIPSSARSGDESSDNGGNGPAKRFQCTQCERAFARAYNLNTHLATHDPDPSRSKPFPCPYPSCKTDGGRSFSRKHDLQRHVASTHENEPEPVTNTIGENGLRQTGALASLGLGTPGRKFRCDDCGRAFVRRDALKRHQCTKIMESPSTYTPKHTPDYYNSMSAGLSLYTSNAPSASTTNSLPQQSQQVQQPTAKATDSAESSYDSDPFGPNGITYENLSKEVQDMAMQLVAQAQSYNEQQAEPSTEQSSAPPIGTISTAQLQQPLASTPSSSTSLPLKSEVKQSNFETTPAATMKAEKLSSTPPPPSSLSTSDALAPPPSSSSHAPTADPISAQ